MEQKTKEELVKAEAFIALGRIRHYAPERGEWWINNLSYKAPEQLPGLYREIIKEGLEYLKWESRA